jgi:alpha-glucosidase
MAFNFPFALAEPDASELRAIVERTEAAMPREGWPVWTLSNHDLTRFPTRWAEGDPERARAALVVLLGLRGTPVLYYGDELGLPETDLPAEDRLDPAGAHTPPGRDGARTPMPWSAEPGAGFTTPEARPWLPLGPHRELNVAAQRGVDGSTLELVRDLLALRRGEADLRRGAYASLPAPAGVWAWRRGEGTTVAANLAAEPAVLDGVAGRVRLSTRRGREGESVDGRLELAPWEAVVL